MSTTQLRPAGPRALGRRAGAVRVAAARPGLLVAGALVLAWVLADPRTPDLAAQEYRLFLFRHFGWQVWDGNWYGGHQLLGYSLLLGPVAGVLGLRLAAALAVLGSVLCFEALAGRALGGGARVATILFAVAAAGDAWIGRVTFALGVTLGLAAALALQRERPLVAAALAALCGAASPVTGLFLALAGAACAIGARAPARGAALGGPALVVAVALSALFGDGGREPFPASSVEATLAAALSFAVLAGRRDRVLRAGALLYLAAVVAAALIASPLGSNVGRLGVLLGAPLLAGAALRERSRSVVVALAVCGLSVWTVWGPVREVDKASGDRSVRAGYYQPLVDFLGRRLGPAARLEVPFTRAHWEADYLAQRFPLARGWERQLDTRYDGLFFAGGGPAPAAYVAWLRALAVRFVALPDAPLDGSSRGEEALVRSGPSFLRPVWRSAHWRVYAVVPAAPAATGAGRALALTHEGFAVVARAAGAITVQVRWSRWFVVTGGRASLAPARGGWTRVSARAPGPIIVAARL